MSATEELNFLISRYFPFGWNIHLEAAQDVRATGVANKHIVRALALLPDVLAENSWNDGYVSGKEEAYAEFDIERITYDDEIEDLKLQIKHLEDELREERCRIHTSNADEE